MGLLLQRREGILQRELPGPGDPAGRGSREQDGQRVPSFLLLLLPRRHLHGRHGGRHMTSTHPPGRPAHRPSLLPPCTTTVGQAILAADCSRFSAHRRRRRRRRRQSVAFGSANCTCDGGSREGRNGAHGGSLSLVLGTCGDLFFFSERKREERGERRSPTRRATVVLMQRLPAGRAVVPGAPIIPFLARFFYS